MYKCNTNSNIKEYNYVSRETKERMNNHAT